MTKQDFNRRSFLTKSAAAGAGAVALAEAATEAGAQDINWDQIADVVITGAGVAGLPAAITARRLEGGIRRPRDANHDRRGCLRANRCAATAGARSRRGLDGVSGLL